MARQADRTHFAKGRRSSELDFTAALLERIFTEPEKIKLAEQRRQERRAPARKQNDDTSLSWHTHPSTLGIF
jgi:hypothetical protein